MSYPHVKVSIEDAQELIRLREELRAARAVCEAVEKMKEESLTYENWYTFVTCEFGEAVDEALAAWRKTSVSRKDDEAK